MTIFINVCSASQTKAMPTNEDAHLIFTSTSEVPAPPINTAMGGKASLQPKRTPVSDREIEAILVSTLSNIEEFKLPFKAYKLNLMSLDSH